MLGLWNGIRIRGFKKSFPSHIGPLGGADLRFSSSQPDPILRYKTTDIQGWRIAWCACLRPSFRRYQILLGGRNMQMGWPITNHRRACPEPVRSDAVTGNRTRDI